MTTIIPPAQAGSGAPLATRSGPSSGQVGADFASMLAETARPGGDLLQAGAREMGALPLRDRLAEVFNEFGFFPRYLTGEQASRSPSVPEADATRQMKQPVEMENAGGRTAAEAGPKNAAPHRDQPRSSEIVAKTDVQAGENRSAPDRPLASIAPSHILEGPTAPGSGHGSPKPVQRLPHSPLRMEPLELEHWRNAGGAGKSVDSERAPADQTRPPLKSPTELGDRIIFRIGEHLVELIARLEGLGDEEQKKLTDALNAVLEAHGLSLGAATINGKPFSTSLLGGQS